MRGMIVGGWEYIYAAYAITCGVLVIYTTAVVVRYRRGKRREMMEVDDER